MFRMVLVALVVVFASRSPAQTDMAEDKAIEFVEKKGWSVSRDHAAPGKPVIAVNFQFCNVTDAELKELAPLKDLTKLTLYMTKVSDAGMKELAPFTKLSELNLCGTKVSDAGLKEIAQLKHLTELNLSSTDVTARSCPGRKSGKPNRARSMARASSSVGRVVVMPSACSA